MPLITETYYLSLTQDNRGILRLRCSQDDTLRTVNLKLYNNGSIFVIPSGISASVSGVKQNGAIFSKPCTISQDREGVVLQLSSDITNVDGIIVAEIVLNDGNGGRLGTSNFIIQVEKNPIRAGVVQDTETPIEYINDFIEKIQTLTARLNNLITPSGDPSLAEVVDARIGILDSTTYQTLGARLNAEFQKLSNALNGITILESTGDTTDRTSEILSKLNVYGTCKLGKGDFYVNSLVMPEGSHLIGSGKSTRVILPSSVTNGYIVKPRSNCIVENISFYGGFTGTYSELIASGANAKRHCIILDKFNDVNSENIILSNIFINNFVGSAIVQRNTVGCHCKDIIIDMCYAGIDISNVSYDGQCTNISMEDTRFGVIQNGSNFIFTNCVSKDSEYHIMSDQQNTGCTFSSCSFSESSLETTSKLASISNAREGVTFDNCLFDSSLSMLLNACDGIVIKGTNFVGSDTFVITVSNGRNTLLLITDCIADVEPTVTNAGTAARITSCYLKDGTAWTISEADITVDDELSDESENPVQNKVINRTIGEIKADLNSLYQYNFWLYGSISKNKVIRSTGAVATDNNYDATDFIPVEEGDVVYGYGARFACYNSEKTFISGATGVLNTEGSSMKNGMHSYVIPANAAYFRICAQKSLTPNQFYLTKATGYEKKLADLIDEEKRLIFNGNLWDYGIVKEGFALNGNGLLTHNESYKATDLIPVVEGNIIYGNGARYACYDSTKTFIPGTSKVLDITGRPLSNNMHYMVVPSGATYFRICTTIESEQPIYKGSIVDGLTISDNNFDYIRNSVYYNNLWSYGEIAYGIALKSTGGDTTQNNDYNTTDYIPVNPGDIIYGRGARYWFYDSSKVRKTGTGNSGILNTNGTEIGDGMYYITVPSGAAYFRICASKQLAPYQFLLYLVSPFENGGNVNDKRTLYCLGDSITRGMYAEQGASSSSGPTAYGYPYWIGKENDYTVVNLGNSGSGWANKGSAETIDDTSVNRNAKDVVDTESFDDADIIILAYGVNDWKGDAQDVILGDMTSASGDDTVIGNMKYCIETLHTKNPTAQIIVLLPMNTNRQWSGMAQMTLENNWAFGYAYRYNQTLQDYRNAIRTCAEYYNVKVIDLEEVCPINRLNIKDVCGDGLHPTKAFHKQMGQALAPLIH